MARCVLLRTALEATLLAMTKLFPKRVYTCPKRLVKAWNLLELSGLARDCRWLDQRAFQAAERISKSRNVVHADLIASLLALPVIRRRTVDARPRHLRLFSTRFATCGVDSAICRAE
jgi:hypothetical protein